MVERGFLSPEHLREWLTYEPESGIFTWNKASGKAARGSRAGTLTPRGYRMIRFNGKAYQAHRLAWFYVHGKWPALDIDHRDLQPDNNAIGNLREATQTQNCANRKANSRSKSGIKGVSRYYHKWDARLRVKGKQIFLGLFDTAEEASAAYLKAAQEHHGEFARAD